MREADREAFDAFRGQEPQEVAALVLDDKALRKVLAAWGLARSHVVLFLSSRPTDTAA